MTASANHDLDRPPPADAALVVALREVEQHQSAVSTTNRQLNVTGLLTIVLGLPMLAFVVSQPNPHQARSLAFVFLSAMTLAGLLLHFTWTEFLNLVRYKYSVLYPRLYRLARRGRWTNYLEFTAPRSLFLWLPALLYNAAAFLVLLFVWFRYVVDAAGVTQQDPWITVLGATFLSSLMLGSFVTVITARTLERDIKFCLGRTYYPPLPFSSKLQLVPYGDGGRFLLAQPLEVVLVGQDGIKQQNVQIPRGFVTDLASVPRPLWFLFPPWERYGPAAVLHDYLYSCSDNEWSQRNADLAFRAVMKALGVLPFERTCIFLAVRLFGGSAKRAAQLRPRPNEETCKAVLERFGYSEADID